jgi:hypothetical protein
MVAAGHAVSSMSASARATSEVSVVVGSEEAAQQFLDGPGGAIWSVVSAASTTLSESSWRPDRCSPVVTSIRRRTHGGSVLRPRRPSSSRVTRWGDRGQHLGAALTIAAELGQPVTSCRAGADDRPGACPSWRGRLRGQPVGGGPHLAREYRVVGWHTAHNALIAASVSWLPEPAPARVPAPGTSCSCGYGAGGTNDGRRHNHARCSGWHDRLTKKCLLCVSASDTMWGMPVWPADLLHAVAERKRRIALVVGAGCSVEYPTGLKLASAYAEDAHAQLVRDGVLGQGDCLTPNDLSALTTAVVAKSRGQSPLVTRLPRNEFRMAQPNAGYLIAAALLREGVLDAVLTVNFDLAMSASLGVLSAVEVNVVAGPQASDQLGSTAVIYLHRNVDEADPERWILTVEALTNDWQEGWEEVVARRVMACPVVVFAGLGSPAAVLTETVTRVRQALNSTQHHVFVVDPAATTEFEAALQLGPAAHLQTGWCAFMERLADRLLQEFASELSAAASQLCAQHSWPNEAEHLVELAARLHAMGLVSLGRLRARWLLAREQYTPDDARRPLLADLLLGVGLVERAAAGVKARFRGDGVVEFVRDGSVRSRVLPASGGGTLRWAALEPLVLDAVSRASGIEPPEHVIVSGVLGGEATASSTPEDLVGGWGGNDIVTGFIRPTILTVDALRADPQLAAALAA